MCVCVCVCARDHFHVFLTSVCTYVCVCVRRAREHFHLALDKYVMELGPNHQLSLDLEHRLGELERYADPHAVVHEEAEDEA